MSKYAVIDIGSNSTHMDIFSVDKSGEISQITYLTAVNKLGQCLVEQKLLSKEKIKELGDTLKEFVFFTKKHEVKNIFAFATSILREIQNPKEVLDYIKNLTGISIDVISEEKEIELAYTAAKTIYDISKNNSLIMDIGGGSCEIIFSEHQKIIFKNSFNIGLSRIKRKLLVGDFVFDKKIIQDIEEHTSMLVDEIASDIPNEYPIDQIIGTSSIFKVIGFSIYKDCKSLADLKGRRITKEQLSQIITHINISGFEDDKSDIVLIGAIFLRNFLEKIGIGFYVISPWSIREPYLLERLG